MEESRKPTTAHTSAVALSITQSVTGATGALLNGDHGDALALFQSALTLAKLDLSGPQGTAPLLTQARRSMPFQLYALPLELDEPLDVHRSSCPASLFSFYNAAVISEEMCSEAELFFSAELSAMILYNLGLVYHRLALMTGSAQYFTKALKLYDVAASIVLGPGVEFNFAHDMTVLQLALYVNMGHIYSNFFEQEGTTRCAQGINSLFHAVDMDTLHPDTRNLFYKNVFVTPSQCRLILSPAA